MKIFEKVKNFFFDDEVEEDQDEEEIEIPVKVHHKEKKENEEITERELFRSERTFNFPMDVDDDNSIEYEVREKNTDLKETVINRSEPTRNSISVSHSSQSRTYSKYFNEEEKKEVKKFKPTPVISPIYGVLDKNYKKEDVAIDASNSFNESKKLNYDIIRKKAYGNMYESNEEEEKSKGIFFNLNEEEKEDTDNDDEVKIVYNDVTFEEDDSPKDEEEKEDNIDVEENNEEEKILSETKEQDLFNLIDNMYNSEEDEEEEE